MLSNSPPLSEETSPLSLEHIGKSDEPRNQQYSHTNSTSKLPALWQPRHQKTKPVIWFAAVLCLIFSLVLIFFGIATLIIYLSFKPRNPIFDIPNASLNVVYFDSTSYLNGEFAFLANFTNPNSRIHVRFESLKIELFFSDRLISSQSIKPFTQRPRETRLQSVKLMSNLMFLPQDVGVKLQGQVQSNRVNYYARGTYKVRFNMGHIHLSHWLHSVCHMEMNGPPNCVLLARECTTWR